MNYNIPQPMNNFTVVYLLLQAEGLGGHQDVLTMLSLLVMG